MMRTGLKLQREKLQRDLPNATPEEIDQAYEAWLLERD